MSEMKHILEINPDSYGARTETRYAGVAAGKAVSGIRPATTPVPSSPATSVMEPVR